MVFIGEDFEKRSFPASIASDETYFFASRNCDRDTIEEGLVAVSEAEFICGEKSHRLQGGRGSGAARNVERWVSFVLKERDKPE